MAHIPHWQQIRDSLDAYTRAAVGVAYDAAVSGTTASALIKAVLWTVIGKAVADFGNELFQYASLKTYEGATEQELNGTPSKILWGEVGPSSSNMSATAGATSRIVSEDPGMYLVVWGISTTGTVNSTVNTELYHWMPTPSSTTTEWAFRRKLSSIDVGVGFGFGLVQLEEGEGVEIWGTGADITIIHGGVGAIRIGVGS